MAIKEIRREWSPCQLDYVKEFLLHSEADVKNLPACCVGSKARVSETGNVYTCSASGEWTVKDDGGVDECESAANKMYVTDADGKPRWEDRLAYEYDGEIEVLPETSFTVTSGGPYRIPGTLSDEVNVGDTVIIYLDGKRNVYVAIEPPNPPFFGAGVQLQKENGSMTTIYVHAPTDGTGDGRKTTMTYWSQSFWLPPGSNTPHTISVAKIGSMVKPIDPKFLPAGAGGGILFITAVLDDSTVNTGIAKPSHTFADVDAAVAAGKYCILKLDMSGGTGAEIFYFMLTGENKDEADGKSYGFAPIIADLPMLIQANRAGWWIVTFE